MHQERLVVFDQKLIELNLVIRMKRRYAINIRSDFVDGAFHGPLQTHEQATDLQPFASYSLRSGEIYAGVVTITQRRGNLHNYFRDYDTWACSASLTAPLKSASDRRHSSPCVAKKSRRNIPPD